MKTQGRYAVAALAMTGFTAATALLGSGVASASPARPAEVGMRSRLMRMWVSAHPDTVARHHAAMRQVADTCHSY